MRLYCTDKRVNKNLARSRSDHFATFFLL